MLRAKRKSKSASWKWSLIPLGVVVLMLAAIIDLTVLAPRRLAAEGEARRSAPSTLVRPSVFRAMTEQGRGDEEPPSPRTFITALRKQDWRLSKVPASEIVVASDPADSYLSGYMALQEADAFAAAGDTASALAKYNEAAVRFDTISDQQPEFQPVLVGQRRKRIAESIARLAELPAENPATPEPATGTTGGIDSADPSAFTHPPMNSVLRRVPKPVAK